MSTLRSNTDDGAAAVPPVTQPSAPAPRALLRRVGWSTFVLCAALVLMAGAGFFWFIWRVPAEEAPLTRNADGIVALTGGASRIADAIELLALGRGKRLLISGANRATNSNEISRLNPEFERWVRCCVDFDRSLNTLGNAIETKRWA
ncbi:MAG: YdcF family protein, partial [Xanthobacteraceae bacterium]